MACLRHLLGGPAQFNLRHTCQGMIFCCTFRPAFRVYLTNRYGGVIKRTGTGRSAGAADYGVNAVVG